MRVLPAYIKKMKHQLESSRREEREGEGTKATKGKSERKHLCRQRETRVEKWKEGREREKSSPSMGSKFGEVSESVSALLYRPLSACVCCVRAVCACVRVLNTFNILWCRLQASMGPQTDTRRTCGNKSKSVGQLVQGAAKGKGAREREREGRVRGQQRL